MMPLIDLQENDFEEIEQHSIDKDSEVDDE